MRPIDDAPLSPGQRCMEVAKILAGGVRRLHTRAANSFLRPALEKAAKPAAPDLEVLAETRLSVRVG